jgi:hypothetical protein
MRKAIETAVGQSQKIVEASMERRVKELKSLQTEASRIVARVRNLLESQDVKIELEVRKNPPETIREIPTAKVLSDLVNKLPPRTLNGGVTALPPGELATLTALIQFPEGLRREQLTVLTQYKSSSRNTYIQRLRERGFIETAGDKVKVTGEGVAALPDAEPLPTGVELQQHWLQRLPVGECKILQALIDAYPQTVQREALTEITGYSASSRNTYLQRMRAKQLWTEPNRGELRASEDLFT